MAEAPKRPRMELIAPAQPLAPGAPLAWSVRVDNVTGRTLHVSHRIQSLSPSADGSLLEVSTMRPALADEVYVPFLAIPTTPVEDGAGLDLPFTLDLPVRIARLTGIPPRAETTEWTPGPSLELRMAVAIADRPFHLPARRGDLAEALRGWGQVLELAPVLISTPEERTDDDGVDQ
jgi:hypothetical protein